MSTTLRQVLGGRNLTGVIQEVSSGIPTDLLPESFIEVQRTLDGDTGEYMKFDSTRQTAKAKPYGSKSEERNHIGMTPVAFKAIHSVESIRHKVAVLMNLMNFENEGKQRLGQQEVARQTREFKRRFTNLRWGSVYSLLSLGAVYFDGAGNLLSSSSGANVTLDPGIPASHKNQLALGSGGANLISDWSTASTSIITEFKSIKRAFRKESGLPISYALYGQNLPQYILANTELKNLIREVPNQKLALQQGEIPDGFMGVPNWRSVNEAFYEDSSGTNTDFFGDDYLGLMPDPSGDWYEFVEGTYPVPNDIRGVQENAEDQLSSFDITSGMFSYALIEGDPPSIKHVSGDTFAPIIRNPLAVMLATVKP